MLGDLVSSFEAVKQKAPARMADVGGLHKFLNSSYASMPTALDTEKCVFFLLLPPYLGFLSPFPSSPAFIFA